MAKNYFYIALFTFFASLGALAQEGKDLGFYPNPVSTGKIFITSKTSMDKDVTIFNVLGRQVLQQTVSKELNIASLSPGVYIVKIREGEATVTRKLIIK
ncbi:T9SS type A sorting domain-containing protein [Flavobacterium selenitireducens]|uniref:T9SS type A sorting domain-containing protein n=1 Tax=Flavobacterium selenitireducens TaxID=2722704 RepID=UPI00168B4A7C|nr:T9SS type A sorting domain-containing protein [Flavobacterium selenitireducens]MBD3581977.1 T9SS type A sorting domain-containing protein [Flavobacterium selenitireducens]